MSKPLTPDQLGASGSEDGQQIALFAQAALHYDKYPMLRWMHAIPNGGYRDKAEAGKLVAMGARSGVWDVFLPYPVYHGEIPNGTDYPDILYAGLYIEMKKSNRRNHKNGGLTDEQLTFKEYAENAGYACKICYSWQEAWDQIVKYLDGE